jgi:hypothetical protein
MLAVFIPCFIAAVRDSTIGFDMHIYGDRIFNSALHTSNLFTFFTYFNSEKIYLTLAYFCAHYANRFVYYFILQLLVTGPVYLTLVRPKTKKYAWLGMLVFFLWVYPFSLNIMRQSISIAIILFSYRYIEDRKIIRFLICVVFAAGFHISAVIAGILYLLHWLLVYDPEKSTSAISRFMVKYSMLTKGIIVLLSVIIVYSGDAIISYFNKLLGRFNDMTSDIQKSSGSLFIVDLLIMIAILALLYILISGIKDSEGNFMMFVYFVGSIIYQMKAVSSQMYRISMFFTSFVIVMLPMFIKKALDNGKSTRKVLLYSSLIVLILIFNFWYFIIFKGWHSIYPYTSSFLGIS